MLLQNQLCPLHLLVIATSVRASGTEVKRTIILLVGSTEEGTGSWTVRSTRVSGTKRSDADWVCFNDCNPQQILDSPESDVDLRSLANHVRFLKLFRTVRPARNLIARTHLQFPLSYKSYRGRDVAFNWEGVLASRIFVSSYCVESRRRLRV